MRAFSFVFLSLLTLTVLAAPAKKPSAPKKPAPKPVTPPPAPPVVAPVTTSCRPNFQGTNVFVINRSTGVQWKLPRAPAMIGDLVGGSKTAPSAFRFEMEGSYPDSYILKVGHISENSLGIAPTSDQTRLNVVTLWQQPQAYTIFCNTCTSPANPFAAGTVIATGCTVQLVSSSTYLQSDRALGVRLKNAPAPPTDPTFFFDFIGTATP